MTSTVILKDALKSYVVEGNETQKTWTEGGGQPRYFDINLENTYLPGAEYKLALNL